MSTLLAVAAVAAVAALGIFVAVSVWRLRGRRVVRCPETLAPAAVEIDLRYAAVGAAVGHPVLRLQSCSRWPERGRCGEPCLDEIEAAPDGCLVRNILAHWYQGRQCAYCHARFGDIHWHDHKPALLSPGGVLREWAQIPAEQVPEALRTHAPVCWNCLIVETLHRQRPDLFEFRPPGASARA